MLLGAFRAAAPLFRTGWFVESLLTELVIALVVCTRRPFFRSRPGALLLVSTALLIVVTFAIPYPAPRVRAGLRAASCAARPHALHDHRAVCRRHGGRKALVLSTNRELRVGVHRSAFSVQPSAFSVRRSQFGVRRW